MSAPLESPQPLGTTTRPRLFEGPALPVFLICLALGLGACWWRAKARALESRDRARLEAAAIGAAIESELRQAASAAEMVAVVCAGNPAVGLAQLAPGLLSSRSAVGYLEMQPDGIVREVFPRNNRVVGFNVMNDPLRRATASAAATARSVLVSGPLRLYDGAVGVVAFAPAYSRGADGRERFWGFGSASIRLPELLTRAGVTSLTNRGFDYVFYYPGSPRQAAKTIAAGGTGSLAASVQQSIKVGDAEFRLALKRHGGWTPGLRSALECAAAVAFAGLIWLLLRLLESRGAVEMTLEDTRRDLARKTEEAKQAVEGLRKSESDAKDAQASTRPIAENLARAEAGLKETLQRLEQGQVEKLKADENVKQEQARSEMRTRELEARLAEEVGRTRALTQAKDAELAGLRLAVQKMQQAGRELESRLRAVIKDEKQKVTVLRVQLANEQRKSAAIQAGLTQAGAAAKGPEAESTDPKADLEQSDGQSSPGDAGMVDTPDEPPAPTDSGSSPRASRESSGELSQSGPTPPEIVAGTEIGSIVVAADQTPIESSSQSEPEPLKGEPEETGVVVALAVPGDEPASDPSREPATEVAEAPASERKEGEPSNKDVGAKPEKSGRRKRAKRDNQMDFFGAVDSGEPPNRLSQEGGEAAQNVAILPQPSAEPLSKAARPPVAGKSNSESDERETAAAPEKPSEAAVSSAAEPSSAIAEEQAEKGPEPATPVKGAASGVPTIEGVDTTDGLARAGNNPEAYIDRLRQFVEQQANAAEKIRDALVQGNPAEAQRKLAALTYGASVIGAGPLQAAGSALERAVREEADAAETEFLWDDLHRGLSKLTKQIQAVVQPQEKKPSAPAKRLPPAPPVDPPELRKAVGQILPLLADGDPGAKDCLKDNRTTFRSAFSPEGYVEFEQMVRGAEYQPALEALKKAAKRHGIPV